MMQTANHPIWQYLAKIRPKLRGNIQIYPQVYRGERWYVLHDQTSGQFLRFNQQSYALIGRFDGDLTLEEIVDHVNAMDFEQPLNKEDVIALIGQLNAAEVLSEGLPINVQDVFGQYQVNQRKKRQRSLMNPLSIKIPLFNPNRWLTGMSGIARLLFSRTGFWIWLAILLCAFVLALANAEALVDDIAQLQLSPQQLILLWIIYPLVKAMHELGHGLALKAWGGDVPEMGINLLVFMPVPYVDATASLGIRNKWRRMVIGAAGIFVELFLAALALFVWLAVEPGLVKQAALNVMLIATLSTLLFNGNPLLRYDGYFILEDWLEIPNLATRSKKYYYYLIQKYILNLEPVYSPVTAKGEKKWFILYGFLAPVYRVFILLAIALYLIDNFLVIGVALAAWAIIMQLIVPLLKGMHFLALSKTVAPKRLRGIGVAVALLLGLIGVLSIPVPTVTSTQGVVWTSGQCQLAAGTSGFVKDVLVPSGTQVKPYEAIIQLEDATLAAKQKILLSRMQELNIQYIAQQRENRVKAGMIQDDLHAIELELKQVNESMDALTIYSHMKGKFILAEDTDIVGSFVQQGDVLGHIINHEKLIVRAMVPQSRIGLLETYDTRAYFKFADKPDLTFRGAIVRQTPQSTLTLPSAALGTMGGGALAVDPADKSGTKLLKPVFQIDISLPEGLNIQRVGGRVYVRLEHGNMPIGKQMALSLNQLFLRHFYTK